MKPAQKQKQPDPRLREFARYLARLAATEQLKTKQVQQ